MLVAAAVLHPRAELYHEMWPVFNDVGNEVLEINTRTLSERKEVYYPPAMTNYTTVANGKVYVAKGSTDRIPGQLAAWMPFDGKQTGDCYTKWQSTDGCYAANQNATWSAPFDDGQNDASYPGQWVQLHMPFPIVITGYQLAGDMIKHRLYAKGDAAGKTWDVLDDQTRSSPSWSTISDFQLSSVSQPYTKFVIKIGKSFQQPGYGRASMMWFRVRGYKAGAKSQAGPGQVKGRYVRLADSGVKCMNLTELEVYESADAMAPNVAAGRPVTKPSGWNGDQFPGKNLTDGNPNSMAHTSCGDVPWMMVDLGRETTVWRVRVRNRVDCCQDRIGGTWVEVLAADGKTVVYTSAPFTGTAGVYEVVPTFANPAADLGAFGIGPWGRGANFVDPLARWIWTRSDAASWAPAGGCVAFSCSFAVQESEKTATLHAIVDDTSTVYLNGASVGRADGGWGNPNYPKIANLALVPGRTNTLTIAAINNGGPAGIVASLVATQGGRVLTRTDGTWTWKSPC